MNNGIRSQAQAAPALPHGLLGSPSPIPTPGGRVEWVYDPNNLVLVFDTSLQTANRTVSVPINNVTGTGSPNVIINWGDGTTSSATTNGFVTKTYATGGVYVVQVSGRMTQFSYGTGTSTTNNKQKLVRCLSFGNLGITDLTDGFRSCSNLIQVPASLPATPPVTKLSGCFYLCSSFNDVRVATWDTSSVTDMTSVFHTAAAFNQNIGRWNTGAVTTMNNMFNSAAAFNQDIGSWNTSNVTSMVSMFQNATSFNQNIGPWNTARVREFNSMFLQANAFDRDIGPWQTTNARTMASMFWSNTAFKQDISNWDIRTVTDMTTMFTGTTWGAANYEAALDKWSALSDADIRTFSITSFTAGGTGGFTRAIIGSGHGLQTGQRINISGTTNYNGDYNITSVFDSAGWVEFSKTFVSDDATGTLALRRSRNVPAGFGSNTYSAGAPATNRGVLTGTYGWTITDGGQA